MVLHPLEFSDCYLDSPLFRENIQQYEEEFETTNSQIKQLVKDAQNMLNAFSNHEKNVKIFSASLQNFQFDCIGENLTDNERGMAGSLKEFGVMLQEVAEEWSNTLQRLQLLLVPPLESFRKKQICSYRDCKKMFEKASERYYKQLDSALGLSHKRKEQQLQEADTELATLKKTFHREALNYVYKLQEVEERKKFEFVEHLLMFMQTYFNYFHQTHETALDCKHYMNNLQGQLVQTREQYEGTREKTKDLLLKMADHPESAEYVIQAFDTEWSRAGYLFLMEKNPIAARFSSKWTKYFCLYKKKSKKFKVVLPQPVSNNAVGSKVTLSIHSSNPFPDVMTVNSCTRRMTDSLDRRFCFDLELEDSSGKQTTVTFQATSIEDRKQWISVMDGKEPEYISTRVLTSKEDLCKLNEIGFQFVKNAIAEIESRGLEHEGIYRLVGITSKVDLLLQNALTPKTAPSVNYANSDEWETNTLTSALKSYFRNLPEPIMTFDFHREFINAAKCEKHEERVRNVASLINQLPEANKKVLSLLATHLGNVQQHHEQNKMTLQNLGVCFGPTLLREQHETVQAILEIKFSNIIVEILTDERELIFGQRDLTNSPRSLKPNFVKLPSQRYKERPVGVVYSVTSLPHILENEETDRAPDRTRFSRFGAIREHSKQSFLRRQSSKDLDTNLPIDTNEYEEINFGKISNSADIAEGKHKLSPSLKAKTALIASKFEPISANSNGKFDKSSSPPLRKQPSFGSKPLMPVLSRQKSLENNETSSQQNRPSPKKRVSPRTRPRSSRANLNSENSNNSNIKPALPSKPKIVSATIKRRANKFEALGVPEPVPKNNVKVLPDDERAKPVQRSKSTGSDVAFTASAYQRRPKSDFIPAAFQVEEPRQDKLSNTDVAKLNLLKMPQRQCPAASNPTSQARSLSPSVLSSNSSFDFSDESSDEDDDEIPSSVARTLYDCVGNDEKELSFRAGNIIRDITNSDEPGWIWGSLNEKRGLVPKNYIQFLQPN